MMGVFEVAQCRASIDDRCQTTLHAYGSSGKRIGDIVRKPTRHRGAFDDRTVGRLQQVILSVIITPIESE